MVFWTCLIESSVVDVHPKLPTRIGDDNRVGQPPWVMDLLDEASIEQLLDLLTNEILLLNGLLLWFLLDGSDIGVDL
jgi:hypothetical protein